MGFHFSRIWTKVFEAKKGKDKSFRILMLGLDEAGKTTILYQLKMGESIITIPTIGFSVDTLDFQNLNFTVWDVGGQDKIRVLWKHYYQNTDALIYVIDSNDKVRFDDAAEELKKMMEEEALKQCPVLIWANKQDLNTSLTSEEVTEKLEMQNIKDRDWLVQGSSAIRGQGLREGLDWLAYALLKKIK